MGDAIYPPPPLKMAGHIGFITLGMFWGIGCIEKKTLFYYPGLNVYYLDMIKVKFSNLTDFNPLRLIQPLNTLVKHIYHINQ